jgi:WhiB family redox-sensing transcriptional regulator
MSGLVLVPAADWRARAACNGAEPDLFFPDSGTPADRIAAAKRICAMCPVRKACLEEAFRTGDTNGICGGLTGAERRAPKAGAAGGSGRMSPRVLAVRHGSYLLVSLVGHRMSVEKVAEQLGSTAMHVHSAYMMLVPAGRHRGRPRHPSTIEKILASRTETLRTMQRLGRSQEYMAGLLETSQSIVSACLAVLRQRDDALEKLGSGQEGGLARLQDEEIRIRLEAGVGLTVDDVIQVAGRSILRMHGEGMPLRAVARELGVCRETVRKAHQRMTRPFMNDLTQSEMGEAA